jgi:excinuclease ABC subunit C
MKRSRLSDIPGLGPKRIRDLLAHFRSIDAIQLASPETLAAAPGMGPGLAKVVWEYFHPPLDAGPDAAASTADGLETLDASARSLDRENERSLELAG